MKKLLFIFPFVLISIITFIATIAFPAIRYTDLIEPTVYDIDPVAFYEKFKNNPEKYVFIDVRDKASYEKLHAVGSSLQPLHTLYTERLNLPKNKSDKTIILICSGGFASGVGYSYLEHYGFRNIARIEGGIENWQAKGLPVDGIYLLK
jgi:rhodanese-related sulfurtransferase